MKSKGPSLVLCGTELGTDKLLYLVSFSLTQKDLLFKNSLIQLSILPIIPYECNLTSTFFIIDWTESLSKIYSYYVNSVSYIDIIS